MVQWRWGGWLRYSTVLVVSARRGEDLGDLSEETFGVDGESGELR